MNPIEYLKQNGYNPDNFRSGVPQRTAITSSAACNYNSLQKPRKRKRVSKEPLRQRDTGNLSLLNTFLVKHGWYSDKDTLIAPLLPYLLADIIMLTHDEYLKNADLRQEEKKHCNAMMKNYSHFIKDFFSCFNGEQKDQAVELMDALGEYIHNELEIFRLAIQQPLMQYPLEFRTTLSAICVCRLLSVEAYRAWRLMFRNPLGSRSDNSLLKGMEHNCAMLFHHYADRIKRDVLYNIDLGKYPSVKESQERVIKKILKFLKEYDEQQSN